MTHPLPEAGAFVSVLALDDGDLTRLNDEAAHTVRTSPVDVADREQVLDAVAAAEGQRRPRLTAALKDRGCR